MNPSVTHDRSVGTDFSVQSYYNYSNRTSFSIPERATPVPARTGTYYKKMDIRARPVDYPRKYSEVPSKSVYSRKQRTPVLSLNATHKSYSYVQKDCSVYKPRLVRLLPKIEDKYLERLCKNYQSKNKLEVVAKKSQIYDIYSIYKFHRL